ncbi:MAG TPA: D-Ala-D-Ala carboxypeptidase family metallohydrolase [Thermoanaerobaculia bacterium]|nr:D-Ala-D-Ala carboxypeptidase family metallohydrolase [Thermoanaerobaculia bacterium]
MTKVSNVLAVLLFAAIASPALHAAEGTNIQLKSLPEYVQRVLVPVVPGTENTLTIETLAADAVLEAPRGFDVQTRNGSVVVKAASGANAGYARVRTATRELTLTLVELVPYDAMHDGTLDGYRVGEYEAVPLKGLKQYERPKGFIRLGRTNASLFVSDHYRMRDFQCKLDGDTKYLVLRTDALVKLEILQHELQTLHGLDFDRFTVMSGYRTPYYNAKIGNETSYSRHLYGDAMDIYIDMDRDGSMDDVNRDGRIDTADARFILRVAERIDESPEWNWLKGGAGVYHANTAHGPYIHIDARGYVARWGAVAETASRGVSRVVAR